MQSRCGKVPRSASVGTPRVRAGHVFIAHRRAAAWTGNGVAGAAERFGAARARILAGRLGEMQALVTDEACRTRAWSPLAGRRLDHACERVPVETDRALALA